jgi:hypothetical protein
MKPAKASTTSARKSKRPASAQPKTNAPTSKLRNKSKRIPPPPGPNASWEVQSHYFDKYSFDEIEKAGYFQPVNCQFQRCLAGVEQRLLAAQNIKRT